MQPLRLSVILPTFNRAASLKTAVEALLRQHAPAEIYEIVVVDNNSTDDTRRVLDLLADPRLRILHEPRQGLSYARNAGLAAARGDVAAFTDDDVQTAPDWVSTIVASLDDHPSIDGVGGRVLPEWSIAPPPWLTTAHWSPLALQDHGEQQRVFDRGEPIGLVGANVAFRRAVFDRIGVFSTTVQRVKDGVGSTEDHELLTRLYEAGGRMLYEPRLLVRAAVQPERYARAYHRRWHFGHGMFHARMRTPEMERSRAAIAGIPAHLCRAALRDLEEMIAAAPAGDPARAFAAELRLRFFAGFAMARLRGRGSRADAAPEPLTRPAPSLALHSATGAPPQANAAESTPAVSVVIPCYNQAHFLEEAIRSAGDASAAVEIVVVDDGSLDATAEVAGGFPHVRYVRQPNQGLAAARNRGLREARGRLIVFLDADDRLLPGGLDRGREELDAHPECAMVFGRCVMMGADGALWPTPGQPLIVSHHHLAFLRRNPIWMPAMAMFRREAVRRAGGFAAGFDAAADYDLYLRLSRESPVHDHGQPVAAYRRHGDNMSGNATRMLVETHAVMRRHRPSRDRQRLSAWREGCRQWRDFYGTQLVEEIRAHRRRGERGAMLRKGLTLMRRNPAMAGREIAKKVRLHLAALPMFASKTKA